VEIKKREKEKMQIRLKFSLTQTKNITWLLYLWVSMTLLNNKVGLDENNYSRERF